MINSGSVLEIDAPDLRLMQPANTCLFDRILPGIGISGINFGIKGIYLPKPRTGAEDLSGDRISIYQVGGSFGPQNTAFDWLRAEAQDNLSLSKTQRGNWERLLEVTAIKDALLRIAHDKLNTERISWEYPDVAGAQIGRIYLQQNLLGIAGHCVNDLNHLLNNERREPLQFPELPRLISTFTVLEQRNKGVWLKEIFKPLVDTGQFHPDLLWWYFNGPLAWVNILALKMQDKLIACTTSQHTMADALAMSDLLKRHLEFSFPAEMLQHSSAGAPVNPLVNQNQMVARLIASLPEDRKEEQKLAKPGEVYGVNPNYHGNRQRNGLNLGLITEPDCIGSVVRDKDNGTDHTAAILTDGIAGTRDPGREAIAPLEVTALARNLLNREGLIAAEQRFTEEGDQADDVTFAVLALGRAGRKDFWQPANILFREVDSQVENLRMLLSS